MKHFDYLRTYISPFKPLSLKLYVGRLAIGTPIFFPRRLVKSKTNKGYMTTVPKHIGFDFVSLGWKIKWDDTDYRFEWNPLISFVFFKWQIVLFFIAPETDNYWECWLYYRLSTDKNKSTKDRLIQARKEFPCIWSTYKDDVKVYTCYWDKILKDKWINT